jgi:hypothetical protein
LQRFNDQGIDAIIASPFPVPLDYGVGLAAAFTSLIGDEKQAHHSPTLTELFVAATERTAKSLKAAGAGSLEEMGLEYVVLGDQNLKLCVDSQ